MIVGGPSLAVADRGANERLRVKHRELGPATPGSGPVAPPRSGLIDGADRALAAVGPDDKPGSLGWRRALDRLGASAAVFTYAFSGSARASGAYFVGFPADESGPGRGARILDRANTAWSAAPTVWRPGHEAGVIVSAPLTTCAAEADATDPFARFHHALAAECSGPDGGALRAVFLRDQGAGPFDPSIGPLLEVAVPLYAEAAALRIATDRARRKLGSVEGMLDSVSLAMFLIDVGGRPFYSNEAARDLLDRKELFSLAPDGSLRCAQAPDTKALQTAVRNAIRTPEAAPEAVLRLEAGGGKWALGFVLPAPGADREGEDRAASLILHPPHARGASTAMLAAFGLLPSEQRFLAAFLGAGSLNEAAARACVSEETARTYLKRVCAKLGVRRQMELASFIYGRLPPLRVAGAAARAAE